MPLFKYEIEMAATYTSEAPDPPWDLMAEIEKLLIASPMQYNYAILKRDGKQIPKSRASWLLQKKQEEIERRREAEAKVKAAEQQLAEAKRQLEALG